MNDVKQLQIQGYRGKYVPNAFWKHTPPSTSLAVAFPGYGYTADMPVVYYPSHLALDRGSDLLQVKYTYFTNSDYRQSSDQDQSAWLYADTSASLSAGLIQFKYTHLILIGKSLGTMAIANLIKNTPDLPATKLIWLTPVLTDPLLVEVLHQSEIPSLLAIGKSDPYYDPNLLRDLEAKANLRLCVYESANHSLEVPGDIPGSLRIMENLVETIDVFLFK